MCATSIPVELVARQLQELYKDIDLHELQQIEAVAAASS